MSWIRNSTLALVLAGSAAAAAADTLVVRSSGPSAKLYPAGKPIADGTTIALGRGDQLTLLDGRGTRVLRGPGSFPTGGAAPGGTASTRFAALVGSGGSDRRVRIGAVRGVGTTAHAPNLWYVDVAQSGTVCVADPGSVTLWRQRADSDGTLTITGPRGKSAKVEWAGGAATVPWPVALAPVGGESYTLAVSGAVSGAVPFAAPATVKLVTLGMRPGGLEDTTAALIRAGCQNQLDTIVDTLAVPGGTAD